MMSAFSITLTGFDFIADVDYDVTSYGCPAQTYGPPENCYPAEGPEWVVNSITLYRDEGKDVETPGFEATGMLEWVLADYFADKIAEQIAENGPEDYCDD